MEHSQCLRRDGVSTSPQLPDHATAGSSNTTDIPSPATTSVACEGPATLSRPPSPPMAADYAGKRDTVSVCQNPECCSGAEDRAEASSYTTTFVRARVCHDKPASRPTPQWCVAPGGRCTRHRINASTDVRVRGVGVGRSHSDDCGGHTSHARKPVSPGPVGVPGRVEERGRPTCPPAEARMRGRHSSSSRSAKRLGVIPNSTRMSAARGPPNGAHRRANSKISRSCGFI